MSSHPLIGIDSGASKSEVVLQHEGQEYTRVFPEGINYQRLGMDETVRRLARVVQNFRDQLPDGSSPRICIGLAGADDEEDRRLIGETFLVELQRTELGRRIRPAVEVVQDSVAALEAAFPKEGGVVVIVGTGSIVIGRTSDGELYRTGGWGYLLGDEGSGHALGLAALRHVARELDGDRLTPFGEAVLATVECTTRSELIHRVYRESGVVQTVAPEVIKWADAGSADAEGIVGRAASGLARSFKALVVRCDGKVPKRFVLAGGLSASESYRSRICSAIDEVAEGWELVEPAYDRPVYGALSLARSM